MSFKLAAAGTVLKGTVICIVDHGIFNSGKNKKAKQEAALAIMRKLGPGRLRDIWDELLEDSGEPALDVEVTAEDILVLMDSWLNHPSLLRFGTFVAAFVAAVFL